MPSPPIATEELAPSRQGARSKSGISPQRPCFTVSCDDWTFHTLEFFFSGRQPPDVLREIKASPLHPEVHSRWFRDPLSGRPRVRGYSVIAHFSSPDTTRLLSLREITDRIDASLREFPWLRDPRLSVSRLDLASDHLVSAPPGRVCDLIAEVNLPHSQRIARYRERGDSYHTVYHVSGRRSASPIPFGEHHRKGKQPVVVTHYPRLEALMERAGPDGVPAAAVEYARSRVRQEVRFRREAIRRVHRARVGNCGCGPGIVPGVRAGRRKTAAPDPGGRAYPGVSHRGYLAWTQKQRRR